ncbi:hypothetical protein E2C01_032361 [Portunus trituberculatus]|uniref:Uncharacterized protein n=1 Tax=Portunus trituberculatus TaxID=210409 RepID=A0A5B7EZF5_PORTR|nr:hypothetical protein [Portunus trituberculatus]
MRDEMVVRVMQYVIWKPDRLASFPYSTNNNRQLRIFAVLYASVLPLSVIRHRCSPLENLQPFFALSFPEGAH